MYPTFSLAQTDLDGKARMYVEVIFLRNPLTYEAGGVCIFACEVLDGVVCMFCTYTVSTPYGRRCG